MAAGAMDSSVRDFTGPPCQGLPMTTAEAIEMLERFRTGEVDRNTVLRAFQNAPLHDLGFAQVDLQRSLRKNFPEVIYGAGKTPQHVVEIAKKILETEHRVLITRVNDAHIQKVRRHFRKAKVHAAAHCVTIETRPLEKRSGIISVLAAGTSDLPVAEEAAVTADFMGNHVQRIYDVGVAGLHRLLRRLDDIQRSHVIIAVAGMEGALPSVLAGLVSKPVIAVPTDVGYGTSFQGVTALLAMLNSCSSGLTVVNINNGFGAAYAASQINALAAGQL